jgi:agmatinase
MPHHPLDARVMPRFTGIRTFMRAQHTTDLAGVDAAACGIPFDTATSFRTGPRFGPEAIRSASALLRPYNPALGVNVVEALFSIVDYGDVPVSPGDTERMYGQVEEALAPLVDAGVFPLALGGDHSVTLAELRVLARRHGPLALVQLDAHGDTWDEYFGQRFHGTTFKRALEEGLIEPEASVQAGLRGSVHGADDLESARELGFVVLSCDQLRNHGPGSYASLVRERAGRRPVFLSFDIDVLDPAFAPGTGTPEVGGLSTAEALSFVRALRGVEVAGADVVEVSPPYDGPGQPTALAAANVAYEILSLRALAATQG